MFKLHTLLFSLLLLLSACADKESKKESVLESKPKFSLISNTQTQIDFKNEVTENLYFNFLNYPYVYNGGGVAVGDINNDGLEDIYFSSNQQSNKLYLNKGDFSFKDITDAANVKDDQGWSTGVSMIDINNDGWLDIYVCKSGSLKDSKQRENKLFINQKNNTFVEEAAKYGLNQNGFSTQAYFLDYDKDGDIDMYLVNHRADFRKTAHIDLEDQQKIIPEFTDYLFQNQNGKFVNVTAKAGISNKAWGLSASIGDFNNDGWPDIFVANDFLEPDFLYINNHDGSFTNQADSYFKHISTNSMGCDFADINNDMLSDLIVLEMAPAERARNKQNMASMDVENFNFMVNAGYHHQYMLNMLQLNNGNNSFSEIGQLANISKTDWSWAPLIADFDNDGYNDIFISNGIKKDLANSDYRAQMQSNIKNHKKVSLNEAIEMMPSTKKANYMFINNTDYSFKNASIAYGFSKKVNSNGAAYADLDNDGDLDLILNNQSEKASVYRNNATNNYLKVALTGNKNNRNGIGAKVEVYQGNTQQSKTLYTNRGYQSSVSRQLNFGIGKTSKIDSVKVIWYDGKTQLLKDIDKNKHLKLSYADATFFKKPTTARDTPLFEALNPSAIGINYKHKKVEFNDYEIQLLLPQKQSTLDAAIAVADVNNDGLEDIFIGNTQGYPAQLYLQDNTGKFSLSSEKTFIADKEYNDNKALFFDADNDTDLDLYITTGNYKLPENSNLQQDRLYLNNGKGVFKRSNRLPEVLAVTKAVAAYDYDNDGDLDLFVGGRVVPSKYPVAPKSYILENRKATFYKVTEKVSKDFQNIGLVNDLIFSDYDNDADKDLIVVGEWTAVSFFKNNNGLFTRDSLTTDKNKGWFQTIKAIDYDADGDEDYFIGNMGKNNKFHPSLEKPLHIYANYFDDNASYDTALSKISDGKMYPARGKECSSQQTPFLNEKITSYKDFANATLTEVYGQEKIDSSLHLEATNFNSFYMQNNGGGNFEIINLPMGAQFGPSLGFEFLDVNKDEKQEVLGIGNIYDAEVETVRYDASRGFILTRDNNEIKTMTNTGFLTNKEVKAIAKISIKGKKHILLLNANDVLTILRIN